MNSIIISILTYNKLEYTKKCIESIYKTPKYPNYEIVVSDNGSTDGTLNYLKTLDYVRLIENKKNLGFAKAHNNVIRMYPDNDIVLVNNDIEVPFGWLPILFQNIKSKNLGAVSPAIQTNQGLDVGAVLDKNAIGRSLLNDFKTKPDWITGSCFYITRDTINKIGLLDEEFHFYYEDVDYCFRMKRAGIKFECIKDIIIIHHNSISSTPASKKQMIDKSRELFIKKWNYNI
jgi:O-antigen biosynthesis protein